jgi:hypothetical protein
MLQTSELGEADSKGFLKQCETDNVPVNLTHYGLWRGYVQKYVSGKSTSTMETRPYFVPSAAGRVMSVRAVYLATPLMAIALLALPALGKGGVLL